MANALDGKTALVTGAGSGIGRCAAIMLAQEGAQVVLAGRRQAPLDEVVSEIKAAGGAAAAQSADMEDTDSINVLAEFALGRFGRVDILVNNAGHSSKVRSARWISREEWDSVMAVNATGPAMLTKALLPAMLEAGEGTVITVSSMAALRGGLLGGAPYGAAKAAVHNYMKTLASELRQQGIRSTTILPAEVDTPILDKRPLPPDQKERSTMMQPEDVAAAILLAATTPHRTMLDEIVMSPTVQRDTSRDIAAAREAGDPGHG